MLSTKADLETNFSDMIKLGEIFGVKAKAEEWVAGQRKTLEAIQAKLKDLPRKRVSFMTLKTVNHSQHSRVILLTS